jgi:uncharacterized protein (DUF1800 family)
MPTNSLRPLKPAEFDYWKAQHLLSRAGFGGTPAQVRALANMGLDDAVDQLVEYEQIEAPPVGMLDFAPDIMRPPTTLEQTQLRRARRRGDEETVERFRRERQRRQKADREQMRDLQRWWLTRMIESPRPLEEKMTLFWHGHFATSYRPIEDSYHMFMQNQLFRSHATGNFKRLVHGIIRDPAMLRYLNNNQSNKRAPNENLGRELMELFTLGEGNHYDEYDIKEAARALTGWTYVDDQFIDLSSQEYHQRHDDGPKRILGHVGRWDGDDLVDIIFNHRAASEYIVWKLYRFFVNDLPGVPDHDRQQFILRLSREFRRYGFNVKPVLAKLFRSEHFYHPSNVGSLVKSPTQLIVQGVRSLHTPTRSLPGLLSASDLMGQSLFFPPSVKGWDGGRAWINTATLFVRQNVMVYLLTGRRPDAYPWERDGRRYGAMHLIEHLTADRKADVREVVTYLLRFNLGREPHPDRVDPLVRFVERHEDKIDNDMVVALLTLITAMPEYQLC